MSDRVVCSRCGREVDTFLRCGSCGYEFCEECAAGETIECDHCAQVVCADCLLTLSNGEEVCPRCYELFDGGEEVDFLSEEDGEFLDFDDDVY